MDDLRLTNKFFELRFTFIFYLPSNYSQIVNRQSLTSIVIRNSVNRKFLLCLRLLLFNFHNYYCCSHLF